MALPFSRREGHFFISDIATPVESQRLGCNGQKTQGPKGKRSVRRSRVSRIVALFEVCQLFRRLGFFPQGLVPETVFDGGRQDELQQPERFGE